MSNQQPQSPLHLIFHIDPSHGWVQVPHSLLWELGIAGELSRFSFLDERYAYLEQDCDLSTLVNALSEAGLGLELDEKVVDGDSPIRAMRCFTADFMPVPEGLIDLTVSVLFEVIDGAGTTRQAQDSFNWQVLANNCRMEITERLAAEVVRQLKFGWLNGKTPNRVTVESVTRNMPDGRYLDFPVVVPPLDVAALASAGVADDTGASDTPMPLEIKLDGEFLIKGDEQSIRVLWNNLDGTNFKEPRPWNPGYTYDLYLKMMEREWKCQLNVGSVLTLHQVGSAELLKTHTLQF